MKIVLQNKIASLRRPKNIQFAPRHYRELCKKLLYFFLTFDMGCFEVIHHMYVISLLPMSMLKVIAT